MRIGKMDRRIVIEQPTVTKDDWNYDVVTWTTLATVWADKLDRGSGEVVERFKQRHDLEGTNRTSPGGGNGESRLASEEMDEEEIGELPRHADDERANAGAVALPMLAEDAVTIAHRIGLGPGGDPRMEEGTGRAQLGIEEGEAFFLGPFAEGSSVGNAGGGEELGGRLVVEGAVLPYIKLGEVEAEDLELPAQRGDHFRRGAGGSDLEKAVVESP